jgi:hypothetical protein
MSGELILFVNDEPNIVQLARMYLERDGFRVQRFDLLLVFARRRVLVLGREQLLSLRIETVTGVGDKLVV